MNDSGLFSSEIVRGELEEMHTLYTKLCNRIGFFDIASHEEKKDLAHDLDRLVEMQEILYTRVFLSDDEDSQQVKENFRMAAKQAGIPAHMMNAQVFKVAKESIQRLKDHLDQEGG